MADLVAKLRLIAETSGKEGVEALASELERLANDGRDAAPRLQELATALREIGQQSGMVEAARGTNALGQAAAEAVDDVAELGNKIGQAEQATKTWREFIAERMGPLMRQFAAEGVAHGEAHTRAIRQIAEEWKRYKETGVAANNAVAATTASAVRPLQGVASSAQLASAAMDRIGLRSAGQIQAEINQIDQDLIQLAANSKVSATEFDRAFARAQTRLDALQREMAGAVDPFTQSVGRASADIDGLTTKLRPLAGAIAAAFSIDQGVRALIDANVQTERLARSLATIATPALSAREQLQWLRELADRNGVAFDRMAQGFTSFAASTRGTALEGEKTRDVFDAVVTSMGRMGRSSEQVELALQALSQIASKGTVSMEELRGQLAEAMPGALQALANGLGLTNGQLIEMVNSGRLLAEDALPALQRELEKTLAAAGPEKVSGMEAGWNRLSNAIRRALDAGQDKRDSTGGFLSWLAEQVDGLGDRAVSLEGSWAGLVRALETGDWGAYTAAVDAHAAAVAAANDKAALAAEQQRMLGAAAMQSGTAAQQAESAWVAINNAYTQATAGAEQFTAASTKAAEAERLEGEAAIRNAELTGNEIAVLEARATAAASNLAAAQQVAAARAAETETLQSQIVALQLEAEQTGGLTDAKRAQIDALQQLVTQKEAEALKAKELVKVLDAEAEAANRAAFSVESAFKRMGVVSSESLKQAADAARRDFDIIKNSGNATARDLTQAFRVVADRTIAANGGVASSALKVEAAMYGVRIEADKTGRAVAESMREAAAATAALGDTAEQTASRFGMIGRAAAEAADAAGAGTTGGSTAGSGGGGGGSGKLLDWGQGEILARAERLGGLELRKQIQRDWQRAGSKLDYDEWREVAGRSIEKLDQLQIEQERASNRFESNAPRVTAVDQTPPRTETIRVEIGTGAGRVTGINTASRSDADALVRLLQQLEADMSRSAR